MKGTYVASLFVVGIQAWEVSYYRGTACRGEFRGSQDINGLPGTCESTAVSGSSSAYVSDNGITDIGIEFFQGEDCGGLSLGFTLTEGCELSVFEGNTTYFDTMGREIDKETYDRYAEIENETGMPYMSEDDRRQFSDNAVNDVSSYNSRDCRGELTGSSSTQGICIAAINSASIFVGSLNFRCSVQTFQSDDCSGTSVQIAGSGAPRGCYVGSNFASFKVFCI